MSNTLDLLEVESLFLADGKHVFILKNILLTKNDNVKELFRYESSRLHLSNFT